MSAKTFSENLNKLVAEAINEQCPLDAMILELTLCEHQTYERYSHLVKLELVKQRAINDAATAKKIIIENGGAQAAPSN